MSAQADEIDTDLIGQHRLVHHVPQDLAHWLGQTIRALGHIAKRIQTRFDHLAPFVLLAQR